MSCHSRSRTTENFVYVLVHITIFLLFHFLYMLYIHLNFYNSILTVTFYEVVFNIRIDNYHMQEAIHVTRQRNERKVLRKISKEAAV
jgi:hypothetical protein